MNSRRKKQAHRVSTKSAEANESSSLQVYERPAPLYTDEIAAVERENVDYTIRVTMKEARSCTARRRPRVYADGVYDMFHSGHARQLMQVKQLIPGCYLIVGVTNDQLTQKMKGQTVMNETERYEAVRHCRYVDELLTDAPWTYGVDFLESQKIDFVAHDDIPYKVAGNTDDMYKEIKAKGMFLATQRTEGISTTDVIARIVKDYDMYIRRNLSRGVPREDLGISYVKEKRIRIREKYESMKRKGTNLVNTIDTKRKHWFDKWEETSNVLIGNFLEVFGSDGRLSTWINEKRAQVARAISPPSSPLRRSLTSDDVESDEDIEEDEELEQEEVEPPPAKRRALIPSDVMSTARVGGH